jgi:ketosteroid isomerase-like protein
VIAERAAAEDFVRAFADGWQRAKPDGFLDHFLPRFHPDVLLVQPTLPAARGRAEAEERFRELFAVFPEYVVTVDDWAVAGDVVWIGVTHRVTVGGRLATWRGADRVVLEDGLLRERVAFFDPLATLPPALRAPRTWPTLLRWSLASARAG